MILISSTFLIAGTAVMYKTMLQGIITSQHYFLSSIFVVTSSPGVGLLDVKTGILRAQVYARGASPEKPAELP